MGNGEGTSWPSVVDSHRSLRLSFLPTRLPKRFLLTSVPAPTRLLRHLLFPSLSLPSASKKRSISLTVRPFDVGQTHTHRRQNPLLCVKKKNRPTHIYIYRIYIGRSGGGGGGGGFSMAYLFLLSSSRFSFVVASRFKVSDNGETSPRSGGRSSGGLLYTPKESEDDDL